MGKSSGSSGDQTVKNVPWKSLQPYLEGSYKQASDLQQQGMDYFPDQTYADMNPLQEQGLLSQYDYAQNGFADSFNNITNSNNVLLNAANVDNNPALQSQFDMLDRQASNQLENSIMPNIGRSAAGVGQYGGSRQGIAEGVAAKDMNEQLLNAKAGLIGNAYTQGLDAQTKAIGLAPGISQLGFMPGQYQQQVGDFYRQEDQLPITEAINRWNFEQQSPWELLGQASSIYNNGLNFGTQSVSAPASASSPISGAVGGAAVGNSILPGWGTAAGAILGGIFG